MYVLSESRISGRSFRRMFPQIGELGMAHGGHKWIFQSKFGIPTHTYEHHQTDSENGESLNIYI